MFKTRPKNAYIIKPVFLENSKNSNKVVEPKVRASDNYASTQSNSFPPSYDFAIKNRQNISQSVELSTLREQSSVQLKQEAIIDNDEKTKNKELENIIIKTSETDDLFNRLF